MAKSISRPDCVHCCFMVRHKSGEYRCYQHNISLYTPISLFCNMLAQDDQADEAYHHWFERNLNLGMFKSNMLYTWVETSISDAQGQQQLEIDAEAIVPITSYRLWTAGLFWEYIRKLRLAKRQYYRQEGYKTDDLIE